MVEHKSCFTISFELEDTTIFKPLLINEQIFAKEVRLIGNESEQLGVVPISQARNMAEEQGLDLVLISPNSNPPVCKIMDYGKYKFDAIKKEKELKKNQNIVDLKEVQLSMTIDTHDLQTKAKHANRFLTGGDKVKIVLRMKGRQQAYAKNGIEIVKNFFEMCSENGTVDKNPEIMGRNIVLIVSPKNKKGENNNAKN